MPGVVNWCLWLFLCTFERITDGENNACQNQVFKNYIDDKIRKVVDNAVMTLLWKSDAWRNFDSDGQWSNSASWDGREINHQVSSGRGPSSMAQNPVQRVFTGNIEITPLMSASNRIDSNVDQHRNEETRNVENFEDGDFPALRPNYDRRAHAHHRYGFTNWMFRSLLKSTMPKILAVCMNIELMMQLKCWIIFWSWK